MNASVTGSAEPAQGQFVPARSSRLDRVFLAARPYLKWIQASFLLLFFVILLMPLLLGTMPIGPAPLEDAGTLSAVLLWGVWLPMLLITAVAAGRLWCGLLCPMGATSEWMSKIGLKRPIPNWLKWSGVPLVSFILISVLNEASGADGDPVALAILFGTLFVLAVSVGLVYGQEKRAWCRHACPIGMTLGVSARLSGLTFTPKQKQPGGERYTEKTLCPTMIDLKRKSESRHCLACGQCIAPNSRGGLTARLRPLGSEVLSVARTNPRLVEVLFLFAAIGIAVSILLEDVSGVEEAVHAIGLGEGMLATAVYILAVDAAAVAVLSLMTALIALALLSHQGQVPWSARFYRVGYAFSPLSIAMLLLCMCGVAFETLELLVISAEAVLALKGAIVALAVIWGIVLLITANRPEDVLHETLMPAE